MKRILLLTTTLFYFSNLKAQLTATDSLQLAFNNATSDTARLSLLFKEKYTKHIGQSDQCIAIYQKGYELAERLNNKQVMSRMAFNIGVLYAYGKSDEGTAFQWYQKGLKIAEEAHDDKGCQSIYYAIGITYDHQGFRDKMYEAFLKALEYSEKLPIPDKNSMHTLINCYKQDKQPEKALAIAYRGVQMMEKPSVSSLDKLFAYANISELLKTMPNQKEKRDFYIKKASAILENDSLGAVNINSAVMIQICQSVDRRDLAIKYANQILELKGEDNILIASKSSAHEYLASVYEDQKNYPLSIEHYKLFMNTRTKVLKNAMTEESGRKVIKAEAERDLLLKQKEADNNRWWAILGFSLAILVLGGGIVAYRFYKREQERKREVDAINATKDKLFSIIAHDLRSPIGTLKTHLMMTNYGMMSQAEFATTSQKLTNNVNALFQTLENLLQWAYSQLKGIKTQAENIHLNATAEIEIKLLSETAHQKNISIVNDIDPSVMIYADANQMSLIIRNLVSNSLKFTHSGGKIVLSTQNTEGGKTLLTITDNGIGMPPKLQKQLFSIQNKTSRQGTAEEKGQGLGLILVKEMVEANQGTLSIESSENKGTVVNIQLPRLKESF